MSQLSNNCSTHRRNKSIIFFHFVIFWIFFFGFIFGEDIPTIGRKINQLDGSRTTFQPNSTVAVLDFEGRGINTFEAATLTDRFSSELGKTGVVRLVDRTMVVEILEEQGFQQSGCTTEECAVEVGALLGVQYMVNGAIGKLGETYTIDAKMVSVETGASVETRNVTYIGKVDGLITEIELLAWDITNQPPPVVLKEKRKLGAQAFLAQSVKEKTRLGAVVRSTLFPGIGQIYSGRKLMGWAWLGSELGIGALTYLNYSVYKTAYDDYEKYQLLYSQSTDPTQIAEYKQLALKALDDEKKANDRLTNILYVGGAVWVTNIIHAFITGPSSYNQAYGSPEFYFAYNKNLHQPQLRLSIALD